MDLEAVSESTVERTCRTPEVELLEVTHRQTSVYEATVRRGERVRTEYVKLYPRSRLDAVEAVAPLAADVGYPYVDHVDAGEFLAVFLREATGRPLSLVLPVVFLPGVWTVRRASVESAYRELGRALGTLHAGTRLEDAAVLDDESRAGVVADVEAIDDRLSSGRRESLTDVLRERADRQTPHAVTHGDVSPHNVYYAAGGVELIDVSFESRAVAKDHASVLLGVDLMVSRLPYVRTAARRRLLEAYVAGYRRTGGDELLDPDALLLYAVRYYAMLLERYRGRTRTLHGGLTRFTDPPVLADRLAEIADGLNAGDGRGVVSRLLGLEATSRGGV